MINIKNLHFAYKRKKIFNGLSLSLQAGHIYGLLGKNGTGKSTLLKSVAGFLFPREGTIDVMGFKPGIMGTLIPFARQLFTKSKYF